MYELASKRKAMTETETEDKQNQEQVVMISQKKLNRRGKYVIAIGVVLLLLVVFVIVSVVLALTLLKPKEPRTKVLSATLEGIAPRVTLPDIDIQVNVTLDLKILVENRNHVSFNQEKGKSFLLYKGTQIGETDIYPGLIPARGSATISCRLTLQADELASNLSSFVGDLLGGQLPMETVSRIPGKVTFLRIIKKHIVAKSNCQFVVGVPDLKIKSQICKNKAKL
ncbi:uncharacterized protein LOC133317663 [Gastrolobium bilobum]|uniref:uncharacterized protein LOC133317663 n=1 Tax=Gastrolobium bilobum TaxID=150636 RepID=UPI002AB0D090|nr:uncharacterized protein LOC133317663 [Gastrolobium bilobum]